MAYLMIETTEFKDEEEVTVQNHEIAQLTSVNADGSVELRIDVTPEVDTIYVKFKLHELVALAMTKERDD
jgi:hypothetical protein